MYEGRESQFGGKTGCWMAGIVELVVRATAAAAGTEVETIGSAEVVTEGKKEKQID